MKRRDVLKAIVMLPVAATLDSLWPTPLGYETDGQLAGVDPMFATKYRPQTFSFVNTLDPEVILKGRAMLNEIGMQSEGNHNDRFTYELKGSDGTIWRRGVGGLFPTRVTHHPEARLMIGEGEELKLSFKAAKPITLSGYVVLAEIG